MDETNPEPGRCKVRYVSIYSADLFMFPYQKINQNYLETYSVNKITH